VIQEKKTANGSILGLTKFLTGSPEGEAGNRRVIFLENTRKSNGGVLIGKHKGCIVSAQVKEGV